jgi:hypothetical protein
MLDRYNRFFRFCGILCDSGKVDESVFKQFLYSLRPECPTLAPFDIADQSSIDQFVAQYKYQRSLFHEKRIEQIVDFVRYNGCYTCVPEVLEVFVRMERKRIDESDFEKVFQRWRETKTPSAVWVLRQEIQRVDMAQVNPFITPLINDSFADSWEDYIPNIDEFEKAIRWVRRRARISKAKAAWREQKGNFFLVIFAVLYELFIILVSWAMLIPVALWIWDWVRSKKRH